MSHLTVSFDKLEKYCRQHGGYDMSRSSDDVLLTFVPTFPEALEKADTEGLPRISMYGKLNGGKVTFIKVEIEDTNGTHEKEIEEAEMTYKSWLDFVEENY